MNQALKLVPDSPATPAPKKRRFVGKKVSGCKGLRQIDRNTFQLDLRVKPHKRYRTVLRDTTRTLARQEHDEILASMKDGTFTTAARTREAAAAAGTIGDLFARFLVEYRNANDEAPRSDDHRDHVKALRPFFGDLVLADTTSHEQWQASIDSFKAARIAEDCQPRMVKNLHTLKTILKWAVLKGLLAKNPMARITIPRAIQKKFMTYFTGADFTALLEAAPVWLRLMLRFAVATGFRRKEITGLKWSDCNFDGRGSIRTNRDSKTGRVESVPMSRNARAVLEEQRALDNPSPEDYVFTDVDGLDYHEQYRPNIDGEKQPCQNLISKATSAACKAIGRYDCSLHSTRHTFGSWLVQDGVALEVVQKLMRHKDLKMTQIYAHLAPEQKDDALARLDARMDAL